MKRSIALLILAGCSSVQWQKPGATRETVDADFGACTSAAQAVPTLPASRTVTPSGAEMPPHPEGTDADRQMQLASRIQACMRDKGYSLNGR